MRLALRCLRPSELQLELHGASLAALLLGRFGLSLRLRRTKRIFHARELSFSGQEAHGKAMENRML